MKLKEEMEEPIKEKSNNYINKKKIIKNIIEKLTIIVKMKAHLLLMIFRLRQKLKNIQI